MSSDPQWSWYSPPGIIALVGIFLDTFVYAPFVVYWASCVYKHRGTLIFSKRYPDVIVVMTIIASVFFLIQRNLGFLIVSNILPPDVTHMLRKINCYAFPIFVYGLYFLVVYRYWLLYYKTQFADAIINHTGWQSIINPANHERNWWITNKKKYGSRSYLIKYVVLVWIVVVGVEGTLWLLVELDSIASTFIPIACDLIIVLGPCILLVYIRKSLPLIADQLLLKVEIKYLFIITIVIFVVTAALASVITAFQYIGGMTALVRRSLLNATYIVGTLFTFLLSYMQTRWIFDKFRSHMRYYTSRQILKTTLEQQIMLTKSEKIKNKNKVSIYDVLTHDQAFVIFMNHLIEEHSSELLLSMVEMIQYKEALLNDMQLLEQNAAVNGADLAGSPEAMIQSAGDPSVLQWQEIEIDNENDQKNQSDQATDEVVEVKTEVADAETQSNTNETQSKLSTLRVAVKHVASVSADDPGQQGRATPRSRRSTGGGFSPFCRRERSATTVNGLLNLPNSVPMSAIVVETTLNFLSGIPGIEQQPARRRGTTIDEDVIQNSSLIRHVPSTSLNGEQAVWNQKVEMVGAKKKKNHKAVARSETEMIEEWKIRAFMIYFKYICVGAEYEINIDYHTRRQLAEQLHDINEWLRNTTITLTALSTLYDNCIHQMYQLCNFSINRFKQTDRFEALVRCFDIQHHPANSPISPRTSVPTQ
eukprot:CAMPEP_0202694726 /NCGR_PEP_ID=MMETSP1385-20130828/8514_1 /ASSEMBLY_ACC=CAM_ASM_000861 /TAXON_ID=933848 /ORGANISM="Elphidium margaritaceum" /LENGTH=702 /DNA_ID=CAMNT_0049350625 /DNA_START=29 /DNA_END=2137 /DNA_ORIENTATION=+